MAQFERRVLLAQNDRRALHPRAGLETDQHVSWHNALPSDCSDGDSMAWPGGRLKHKSSASPLRHPDAEQRAVLLAAEDVGVPRAAAGDRSGDREFDRQRRVEL